MHTSHSTILPAELKNLLTSDCCLVDVREPIEHAQEHIPGAKLIPLAQIEERVGEIDPNTPLIIMCRSGKRGVEALKTLERLGITGARNLEGGMLAWKADGHPVSKSSKNTLPLIQQVQITIGIGVLVGALLSITVDPNFVYLSAFFGAGLVFAGTTGWCGLAVLISKMPWNRVTDQSSNTLANGSISN